MSFLVVELRRAVLAEDETVTPRPVTLRGEVDFVTGGVVFFAAVFFAAVLVAVFFAAVFVAVFFAGAA
ncbi:hypothetical protein [Metallococcus carri]|uniref:hypothetical protein n=1 Tax=Metallococcus carri TaxID=1656884 RepID=UPI001F37BF34|nr:hypothetical protein [Metallococcus carri]